jgi:methyltransferase (TIGR00027 family)
MAQIRNVSGTAFVVAEFRAAENRAAAPLYRDPIVEWFLDDATRYAAGFVEKSFPQVKDLVRIRTKYLDDVLDRHIQSGISQVAILGAGLDTRAVRKQAPGVTYFEIDDPATLALKQTRYHEQGIELTARFIPGNYVTDGLADLLAANGFDFDAPSYFIWEGNTMYLPIEGVRQIMAELRKHVRRFRLSFDYMAESVIAKTTGDPGITSLVEAFESMGAPWRCGIRDVGTLARDLSLSLIENFKTSELYRRYWLGRPMTSPIFNYYSLCTLTSPAA